MTESSSFTLEFDQFSQRRGQTHSVCTVSIPSLSALGSSQVRLPKGAIPSPSSPSPLSWNSTEQMVLAGEGRQNLPCTDHSGLGLTQLLQEVECRGTSTPKPLQPPLLSFQKCHCGTLCFLKQCLSLFFDCLGQ